MQPIPTAFEDFYPLIYVMRESDMSNRNVAHALGCYCGKDYKRMLHDVGHVMPNLEISDEDVKRVEARLEPHGLASWLEED